MSLLRVPRRLRPLPDIVALVTGAALIVMLVAPAALAQGARLSGQVVDENGEPVSGITVTLENEDRAIELELVTDDDGRFARTGLEPGLPYQLTIDAPGYLPVRQQMTVGERGSEVEIRLQGGEAYARTRYDQGYQAYEQRDFEATADAMSDVADATRDAEEAAQLYRDALVLLGFSRGQLGELDAAAEAYGELIEAAPEDSRGYFGLGGIQASRGEVEAAIENFQRAAELAPDNLQARYALGAMYVETQRWEEAIPPLQTLVEAGAAESRPIAYLWLGNAYGNTEQPEAAIEAFETYLELVPDAPEREQVEAALETLRERGQSDGQQGDGDQDDGGA